MRLALFLFVVFDIFSCYSQLDIRNLSSSRQDSNVVFVGLTNRVSVTGPKNAHWQLKSKAGKIDQGDSSFLFTVVTSRLGADTFYLSRDGKLVLTKVFFGVPEPSLIVRWGALKSDTASAAAVIANKRMIIFLPGYSDFLCQIFSFEIAFVTNQLEDRNKLIKIVGPTLTPDASTLIARLRHGDKILFRTIVVEGRSARLREIPGFTIIID